MNEVVSQISEYDAYLLNVMMIAGLIFLISFIVTIVYSSRNGGLKEVIENLFLWFILFFGFGQLFMPKVDSDDEITAGLSFVAFGLCRIAKHLSKKNK